MPLPRVDVRARRRATSSAARRPRAGVRQGRVVARAGERRHLGAVPLRQSRPARRVARRAARRAAGDPRPRRRRRTTSSFTHASSSAPRRTGRWSPRTSSSATTARPRTRRSVTRSTCTRIATCSRRIRRSARSSASRRRPASTASSTCSIPTPASTSSRGRSTCRSGRSCPAGPNRTERYLDYFFAPDVDEDWRREFFAFDDQVGREDRTLVESVQRGMASGMLEHGRLLLDAEPLLAAFQGWVRDQLA